MRSISRREESEEGEERAAGFVLFRMLGNDRQYLLVRHRSGGHWAFPKGRLEFEETEIEAATREIFEETSINQLHPIPGFCETSHYSFERNGRRVAKSVAYYLAKTDQSEVSLSKEHTEFQWLNVKDAEVALTHDDSRRILQTVDRLLAAAPWP